MLDPRATQRVQKQRDVRQGLRGHTWYEMTGTGWETVMAAVPEGRRRIVNYAYAYNPDTTAKQARARIIDSAGFFHQITDTNVGVGTGIRIPAIPGFIVENTREFHLDAGDYIEGSQSAAPSLGGRYMKYYVSWIDQF